MPEKPISYYKQVHQKYLKQIVHFKYSLEKNDPIKKHLDQVKKIPKRSLSGDRALQIYEKAKKLGLYEYQPIVMRVYIGQLLLRLNPDGSTGFIKFIKFIQEEAKSLHPLVRSQVDEVIKLVKKYGGNGAEASAGKFKKMLKGGKEGSQENKTPRMGREKDPIFDDDLPPVKDRNFKMGSLEPISGGKETLRNLDPFQTALYHLLVKNAYWPFRNKIMDKTGGWKKIVARNEGVQAINDFNDWIKKFTKRMAFSKGKRLLGIFDSEVSGISFPSLKIKVAGVTVADHRGEAKKLVTQGLMKLRPIVKGLSSLPQILFAIIGRKQGYATGKNRAFLNRFHKIARDRYFASKGTEKYVFEFIAMAMDRIKDDAEFAKLSNEMKPVIARLLKGVPSINELSQKVFKKPIGKLTQKQIESLLNYVLPSNALTEAQKQSELNQKLLKVIQDTGSVFSSLRKTDPEKYRLVANILHIAKNDVVAIGTEQNMVKAKKKLAEFYKRFQLVRSMIGEKLMKKIEKTNKYAYMLLTDPETTLGIACAFNKNLAYVKKEFEKVRKARRPRYVVSMIKEAGVTKQYLLQRFKQAQANNNMSLIVKYGNQLRATDLAIGMLKSCWTERRFKENELSIRAILHDTPYLMVSRNVQKYINLISAAKVENAKRDYKSLLGATYDIKKYLSGIVKNKLFRKNYAFARDRMAYMVDKIVASHGYEVAQKLSKTNIDPYTYLKRNYRSFVGTVVSRVAEFLKTTTFRDGYGRKHHLHGLNRVQVALLKRNMSRYISKKVLPKVKRAIQA